MMRLAKRAVAEKVSAPETRVPLDVYVLMVHAQDALANGDTECAQARLELALRRCER